MLALHVVARFAAASLTPQPLVLPLPETQSTLPLAPEPAVASAPPLPPSAPPVPESEVTAAPLTVKASTKAVDDDPAVAETRIPGAADPFMPLNRISYAITQPIDRFILRPAAIAYTKVVPAPLRDGARNAIQNLSEPLVIFNDLLQLRPGRAVRGVARIVLNSVIGIGGLFDVAKRKPFAIPHHANGFGDTFGYYGVGPIFYLYLPVLGPTTLRDTAGGYVDDLAQPRLLYKISHPDSDKPVWSTRINLGTTGTIISIVDGLDKRAENDQELESIRNTSVDPYAALRANYLQDRAGEIAALRAKDGKPAANPHMDDPLADPAATK